MSVITYRGKYEAHPAPLPALFRPVSTDLGNPSLFHAPFDARGLRWAIVADDANRSWQVPLFRGDGSALWHWGQIRKRNRAGWQDGIGAYLDAERAQMDQLGLTYRPELWLTQGRIMVPQTVCPPYHQFDGEPCRIVQVPRNDGVYRVYRRDLHDWQAVDEWTDPGEATDIPIYQCHNDTVTLVLKGSKVWARCNPWLRIAMPYGMPGEVASDSAAWNALETLKGALEIIAGYLTDNMMLIAKGGYDIIETWYEYATADARERARDQAINDGLKGQSGSQGLQRGSPAPVITWTARKKARR